MLKAIKNLFEPQPRDPRPASGLERRQLQVAVAALLHEARRADSAESEQEHAVSVQALVTLFGLAKDQSAALLEEGRARAQQFTSYYAPVTIIKREYSLEERSHLIEHLWRVAFADGKLNPYEDHFVRKIAHLLHVPNTQSMLARNRARL